MAWFSAYGTGATMFDVEPEPEGRVRFTVWLSFFFVPIVPLSSWSAIYLGETIAATEQNYFKDLVRVPHVPWRLARTFFLAMLSTLVTIGPLAFMIHRKTGRAGTRAEATIALSLVFLATGIIIGQEWNRGRKLSRSQAVNNSQD